MHLTKDEFLNLAQKNLTLIGMSGLGKTTLSEILAEAGWFHYSADYRIGTKYLEEPILDNLRTKIRTIPLKVCPFLRRKTQSLFFVTTF